MMQDSEEALILMLRVQVPLFGQIRYSLRPDGVEIHRHESVSGLPRFRATAFSRLPVIHGPCRGGELAGGERER